MIESPLIINTKLPKSVIQKRNYLILSPEKNLEEFDYGSLLQSLTCPIIIGHNMMDDLPPRLAMLGGDTYCIITDTNVKRLYGEKLLESLKNIGLDTHIFSFDPGEKNKTFTTIETLCNAILDTPITKNSVIIALGGGVVGNIAGLVANLLMRGIRFVQVPTTVMHQVDASTGGKQAVNTYHGKNMLGSFYEPEFIYNDISCIQTLSPREYANGIAEVIKHGLCESTHLLALVDKEHNYKHILEETLKHKIAIMEEDPREHNKGYILIYGHTIGHAIETLSDGKLLHGEAIAIGMTLEAMISHALGYCSPQVVDSHRLIFARHHLPTAIPPSICKKDILAKLLYDKKERHTTLRFPLLQNIGQMLTVDENYAIDVPQSIIESVIDAGYK